MIAAIRARLSRTSRRSSTNAIDTRWWHWDGTTWQPPAGWVWEIDRWVAPGTVGRAVRPMASVARPALAADVREPADTSARDELSALLDDLARAS